MLPLHPLVVHFPLALLVSAAILEWCSLMFKRRELSRAAWWCQLLGTLMIGFAVVTGLISENALHITPQAMDVIDIHEELAFAVSASFAALLLWRLGARTNIPGKKPWLYLALFGIAVVALIAVGWFGGELVFQYGVGVRH